MLSMVARTLSKKHSVEAVEVHRRVWKRGNEYLGLRCYERDGERYAERVELYRSGDGADLTMR